MHAGGCERLRGGAGLRAATQASMRGRQLVMQNDAALVIQRAVKRRRDAISVEVATVNTEVQVVAIGACEHMTAQSLNGRVMQIHAEQMKSRADPSAATAQSKPTTRNWLLNDRGHDGEETDEGDDKRELQPMPVTRLETRSALELEPEPELKAQVQRGVDLMTELESQLELEPAPDAETKAELERQPELELKPALEPEPEQGALEGVPPT